LEELAPFLRAGPDIDQDQKAGRAADDCEGGERGTGPPDTEAVDESQADPDEVKRDRLPGLPAHHGDEVRRGEGRPGELDGVTLRPGDNPHGEPSRLVRRGRASYGGDGCTLRPHSSPDRSCNPTP